MWVDQEKLDVTSAFVFKGGLDHAFNEVGPSTDYGVFVLEKFKKVCSKYGR